MGQDAGQDITQEIGNRIDKYRERHIRKYLSSDMSPEHRKMVSTMIDISLDTTQSVLMDFAAPAILRVEEIKHTLTTQTRVMIGVAIVFVGKLLEPLAVSILGAVQSSALMSFGTAVMAAQ